MNSESNNFILSADPLSNSSDSVNIKELVVTNGVLHKTSESSSLPKETDILISDTDGLNKLLTLVKDNSFDFLDYTLVLIADLDFAGEASFNPIGNSTNKFKGTFDGQEHTISNLEVSGVQYAGLFGYLGSDATVKNLGMIGSDISASSINGNAFSGGIAGYNSGTILNCYNFGTVTAKSDANQAYSGGITGVNAGEILSCYNAGLTTAESTSNNMYLGGVVGLNGGSISYSYNMMSNTNITENSSGELTFGGVLGYNTDKGTITGCYNVGDINITHTSGNTYLGGVIGNNNGGIVLDCYNVGSITGTFEDIVHFGGIVGSIASGGTIVNCFNLGNVTTTSADAAYSGGVVGDNQNGTVSHSYNAGNITIKSATGYSGGIVGDNNCGVIKYCYNTGFVNTDSSSTASSGGIAGWNHNNNASVISCYNVGGIRTVSSASVVWSGGIAGINTDAISNCYNTGSIYAKSSQYAYSGGIAGQISGNTSSISNCYNIGFVTVNGSDSKSGGIAGVSYNNDGLLNAYHLKGTAEYIAGNGTNTSNKLDMDAMKGLKLLSGTGENSTNLNKGQDPKPWSPDIFGVNDGYPILADVPLSIILGNSVPHSSVYLTFNDEAYQSENYLKPKVIITNTNNKLSVNLINLNTDLKVDTESTSYAWKKLGQDKSTNEYTWSNIENEIEQSLDLSSQSNDGTYYAVVTFDVGENEQNSAMQYHYISLSRTVEMSNYSVYYYYLNDNNKVTIDGNKSPGDTVNVKDIPVKSGYNFNHWLMYNYGDTTPTTIQANATFKMPSSDVIMIADWEKTSSGGSTSYVKQYSVIYVSDADTSNAPYDNKLYTSGSSASVLKNNLSKEGFISNGWNTKADGTGTQYKEGDSVRISSSNIILYAQFKEDSPEPIGPDTPNSVSVTFYVDDKVYNTVYAIKGSCLENNMPDSPEKQNSTFKGWFYSDSEGNESEFNSESIVNNDMSIYAVFESNQDSNASSLSSSEIIIIIAVIALIAAALILYLFFFRKQ